MDSPEGAFSVAFRFVADNVPAYTKREPPLYRISYLFNILTLFFWKNAFAIQVAGETDMEYFAVCTVAFFSF